MGVKWEPVATMVATPAKLPVFDESWKKQCKSCKHCLISVTKDSCHVLRCRKVVYPQTRATSLWKKRGIDFKYCIDARDSECGPDATLWEKN